MSQPSLTFLRMSVMRVELRDRGTNRLDRRELAKLVMKERIFPVESCSTSCFQSEEGTPSGPGATLARVERMMLRISLMEMAERKVLKGLVPRGAALA